LEAVELRGVPSVVWETMLPFESVTVIVMVPSLLRVCDVVSVEEVDDDEELELELVSDDDDVLKRLATDEPPMEEIEEDMD
jgi:hypothetical protein